LVRLDPNIPWKTRGNAALAVRIGIGRGARSTVGAFEDGAPIAAYAKGGELPARALAEMGERLWATVLRTSDTGTEGTDPALVLATRRPPSGLYWAAVHRAVGLEEVEPWLRTASFVRTLGSRRGLIGASAALAWPAGRATWEVIAYREPGRWGTARSIDAESVRRAAARHPELFLCHDARTRRLLVAPHTACPILFGLRGRTAASVLAARGEIVSEPVGRWCLFRTNQGTGDHVRAAAGPPSAPYEAGILEGSVAEDPTVGPGGHVTFELLDDRAGAVRVVIFEPTKSLARIGQSLRRGDRVRVWGGRGLDPTFRAEGLVIDSWARRWSAARPPRCGACGRRTRSLGRERGYRCPVCRLRLPPETAERRRVRPDFPRGRYDPTPSARRHLGLLEMFPVPRRGPARDDARAARASE
jgi:tRNA(Ile2)-agmatinylcytidine synthase